MAAHGSSDLKRATMNGVLFLLGLSVFVNYIDRANLSVAAPLLKNELALSSSQLGILLSAFFWTYAGMQPVMGWLVDRFEVKWVFALGFLLWSGATAATAAVHGFAALLFMRVILGVGESVAYPSYCKIFATHFAENQRGLANSVIGAGQALGPGLGMLIGGFVVMKLGWRWFFLVVGLSSLLWLVPWLRWMPRTAPTGLVNRQSSMRLAEFLEQKSAWGTWIALFCTNYFLYFLLTWLPLYLVNERHFSMQGMAKVGGSTFLMAAASSLTCGRLSDHLISAGSTATRVRKTFLVSGTTCVGFCMAGVALVPDLSSWLLILAGAAFGLVNSNQNAITQTLAGPVAAGRWMGIQNFVGNLAGWIAPALTGLLVERTGHYCWPFLIVAVVTWIGTLVWLFLVGRVEPVIWKSLSEQ
jgi:ACS family D-galactonate transporter-like MFS transporter